jgi:ferrous iron transport protein B
MHRELGSWKSTGLAVAYQCIIAYAVASIVYVIGSLIGGDSPVVSGIVMAIISVAAIAYLLISKDPFFQKRKAETEVIAE